MFAALYIPDFPVAAVVRCDPALRGKAVAVLEGKPPVVTVAATNEQAAEIGIEPGMTKLQAAAYPVELRQRSAEQEAAAHAALLDCAQAFSPRVEDTAADTVVLDIAGLERLFGPPAKLARSLAERASELGLEANVAIAGNPDAAIQAARGFTGVTVIPPGKQAERLGGLPVDVLEAAPEILETLDRWGVRNLRALAALPAVAIVERLGQEGLRLQKLARGAVERPLVPAEPPLRFEETMELEYPVELLEPLAFVLGRLLEQVCARLGARALATNELRLRLGLEDVSCFEFQVSRDQLETRNTKRETLFERAVRLPVPMLDARLFLKLLQLDLRAHPPSAPVSKVMLMAVPVEPRPGQGGLFLPESPAPDRLELTLARLAGIVGEQKIGAAELVDTHRPDAFRMTRFAPAAPQGVKPLSKKAAGVARLKPCPDTKPYERKELCPDTKPHERTESCPDTNLRSQVKPCPAISDGEQSPATKSFFEASSGSDTKLPTMALRRFRPPIAASVELSDGAPVRITASDIRGEVASLSGPWRTSGDWWGDGCWDREEWDIAVAAKDGIILCRVYRDLATGGWFVEGTYD